MCSSDLLGTGGIDDGAAVAAAVKGNDAESGGGERGDLIFPGAAAASGGVQKDDGSARAARIDVAEANAGERGFRLADLGRLLGLSLERGEGDSERDEPTKEMAHGVTSLVQVNDVHSRQPSGLYFLRCLLFRGEKRGVDAECK